MLLHTIPQSIAFLLVTLLTVAHPAPSPLNPVTNNGNLLSPSLRFPPSPHRIHCIPANLFPQVIHPVNPQICLEYTVKAICAKLTFPFPPRGVWQWAAFPNCAMGFYLPPTLRRGEGLPTKDECVENIFTEMVQKCLVGVKGGQGAGVAMSNVKTLPDGRNVGRGIEDTKARFLMGAQVIG
ncbi:MAG: hypothetical protein Q9213_006407 [Squamulea squamosa]